jgi:hypothetical protein
LGVDQSANAIRLTYRCGAPALLGDVFQPLVSVGVDCAAMLAGQVGLRMGDVRLIGERVIAGTAVS